MTEKEKLMYNIISRISAADAPIIFKGALITNLILQENGYTDVQRMTKDIDANWVGNPPSMMQLVCTVSEALGDLNEKLVVEIRRSYAEGRSAGLEVRDKMTLDKIISMDIDIKPYAKGKTYFYGRAIVKGVLANDIIADKISAISGDAVYKYRTKDLIDVYALTHCVQVNVKEIVEACKKSNRNIQSFEGFLTKKADVLHAYEKLRGVQGKPDFSILYNYLSEFLKPFINMDYTSQIWDPNSETWIFHNLEENISHQEDEMINSQCRNTDSDLEMDMEL